MGSPRNIRNIDERDLDKLLKHLTNRQIAGLYDLPIETVQRLRFDRVREKKKIDAPEPVKERNR